MLSLGMLCSINHPPVVSTVTLWVLMVKCYHQPLLLLGLLIPIALSEPNSVTTSPAFNGGLQRRAMLKFIGMLDLLQLTFLTPLANGVSFGPLGKHILM